MVAKPGNEMADLIRCLSGAQANDSGGLCSKESMYNIPNLGKSGGLTGGHTMGT
jgi:hypothetical protein